MLEVRDQRRDFTTTSAAAEVRIGDGVRIRFHTSDEQYSQMKQFGNLSLITAPRNPVTGPIRFVDVDIGDVLAVTIERIDLPANGWVVSLPQRGALAARMGSRMRVRSVPIIDGAVHLSDRLVVPARPMIGCLGVAPATGYAGTMAPAVPTGGNLDLPDAAEGATVYLPVRVPGGWFALGDIHAVMARGEATFVAVESAGSATVRIRRLPNEALERPRIRTPTERISVGLGESANASVTCAMLDLFDWVARDVAVDPMELYALMSAEGHTELGGPVGSKPPGAGGESRGVITLARLADRWLDVLPRAARPFDDGLTTASPHPESGE